MRQLADWSICALPLFIAWLGLYWLFDALDLPIEMFWLFALCWVLWRVFYRVSAALVFRLYRRRVRARFLTAHFEARSIPPPDEHYPAAYDKSERFLADLWENQSGYYTEPVACFGAYLTGYLDAFGAYGPRWAYKQELVCVADAIDTLRKRHGVYPPQYEDRPECWTFNWDSESARLLCPYLHVRNSTGRT